MITALQAVGSRVRFHMG